MSTWLLPDFVKRTRILPPVLALICAISNRDSPNLENRGSLRGFPRLRANQVRGEALTGLRFISLTTRPAGVEVEVLVPVRDATIDEALGNLLTGAIARQVHAGDGARRVGYVMMYCWMKSLKSPLMGPRSTSLPFWTTT